MHPDLGEPAFAKWYTSDPLTEAVEGLLGCTEDELQMGKPDLISKRLSGQSLTHRTRRAIQYADQPRIACICFAMAS